MIVHRKMRQIVYFVLVDIQLFFAFFQISQGLLHLFLQFPILLHLDHPDHSSYPSFIGSILRTHLLLQQRFSFAVLLFECLHQLIELLRFHFA